MKKLYSFFIAIIVAVSLAGCGNKPAPDANAVNKPLDIAALKQAVQTFNTKEGHYPKTLDELMPKYLPKMPEAPNGYKIKYTPASGEVQLTR